MTIQFNVYVSKAFDFLTEGVHYLVTLEGGHGIHQCLHFQNLKTGGGVVLRSWQVEKAFDSGYLIKE